MKIQGLVLMLTCGLLTAIAATPSQTQKSRRWIGVLQSDAPLFERAQACRQLAVFGSDEAVSALAALLPDETLSHYAREALEAIPHPSAGEALRRALHTVKGNLLVGVVNSLGMRRDTAAVNALSQFAGDSDSRLAAAALVALGRIGGPDAIRALQHTLARGRDDLRAPAAEGCLLIADRHLAGGRRDTAAEFYDTVRRAPVAAQLRASATRGAIIARGAAGLPLLLEQLRSKDVSLRDVALGSIRDLPHPQVTWALVTELETAEPSLQTLLIFALMERTDDRVLAAIEAKAKTPSEEVRIAALQALGQIGRNSSVSLLLEATRASSERESAAALASLARIKAPDTQTAIFNALPSLAPAARAKLIAVVAERNDEGAAAKLLDLAQTSDVETTKAALRTLAVVAHAGHLPELIQMSVTMRDDERKTLAARAVASTAMKMPEVERRADAVLAQLSIAAEAHEKISLLRPLGPIVRSMGGSEEAFTALRSLLNDQSGAVREAAIRCLGDWPDAAPCMTLLEVATRPDAPPANREIALRGAVRMAANVAAGRDRSSLDALSLFIAASQAVRTNDEKLMLVSGLSSLKRIEAIQMIQPHLEDPAVQTEAALAITQIAPSLLKSEHGEAVRRVLQKIAATEKDKEIRRTAAQLVMASTMDTPKSKQSNRSQPP